MTLSNATPRHSGLTPGAGPRAVSRGSIAATQAAQPSETESNPEIAGLAPDPEPQRQPHHPTPGQERGDQGTDENPLTLTTATPAPTCPVKEHKRRGPPAGRKTLARTELSYEFRRTLNVSAEEALIALGAMEAAIRLALVRGETVKLHGVGSLTPVRFGERVHHNPRTGERFKTTPTKVRFRAAADLRAAIAISL